MKNVLNLALTLLLATPLALQADDQTVSTTPAAGTTAVAATPAATKKETKDAPTAPSGRAATASNTDTKAITPSADASITPPTVDTRYGIFDALDKRSVYGLGVFPEPFLVDDSDGETDEGRLDLIHTGCPGNQHTDYLHGELEKGFGLLTLELETAYERDSSSGEIAEGMDNVDLGARYPFYQWVSRDGDIDNTFGLVHWKLVFLPTPKSAIVRKLCRKFSTT